eukprot:COSAG05_NODE_22119_length_267_cov_0.607143_1_plen_58_part_10
MVTLSSDLVTQLTFLVGINTLEILVAASPVGCTMSSLSEGDCGRFLVIRGNGDIVGGS